MVPSRCFLKSNLELNTQRKTQSSEETQVCCYRREDLPPSHSLSVIQGDVPCVPDGPMHNYSVREGGCCNVRLLNFLWEITWGDEAPKEIPQRKIKDLFMSVLVV